MQYFPLFVDTKNLQVLVVGAGEVATRKLDLLSRTEADITVIAPDIAQEIQSYHQKGRIRLHRRVIEAADIADYDVIYMATANEQLNKDYAVLATQKGIWVNVVDNPSFCRFITPSIVDRGRLVVAISTAGAAPVFARTIRSRLETLLPQSLSPLFDFVASKRTEVQQKISSGKDRRLFWERFFKLNSDRFDSVTEAHYQDAFSSLAADGEILLLDENDNAALLPIAAMPLLQKIEVIYRDSPLTENGVSTDINELIRRDASREAVPNFSEIAAKYHHGERMLLVLDTEKLKKFKAHFPMAKHLQPGAL
ncbi:MULTISPECIES: bifunctional precorrin-2 dehydrogenase/sirohydrochlorin ferrochelatase [unclassified Shewanella]|uniref:precorrin-2 dehydrogenase/sirohydrochlorin ferrochelatase family protein n=1 Tax=unclassified Shewanella TaxID=196818 RepID=UPI000C83B321|nr:MULTISPECIES: bifunctional precorrin-2 dehydrogenase/sirohydrochlorin ferrochelatase [unclassified Shewanella]MDO6619536.1 bifunctional precorrin-2 dehydrogenase/sirohydrochlorin ferrochelatase [Shewanella sp. 6_MG-2023]MDO6641234.1 bifunctional precorrin-2 dehydrogenase/sirohydrochlorin ferrochelatase [Shewanella sp. 5_MG-2023]MDO6775831.1 bifunctional precorrin-2 dehydrogenase/sirohydrochlorin ferrochelatase [Shewanella sp. 3_MG-2023]PMG29814.1 siroheme synthase [Shewanella sp. 10N.286.52.